VNIKILTGMLERTGELTRKRRDTLLQSMTDEIADHVLAHNYDQTLALSLMEMDAAGELGPTATVHGRAGKPPAVSTAWWRALPERRRDRRTGPGRQGPDPAGAGGPAGLRQAGAEARDRGGRGRRRPLFRGAFWRTYFPRAMRKYAEPMRRHRLRREIIATSGRQHDVINRCGPSFPHRLMPAAGADATAFAAGYEAAKAVLRIPALWDSVAALDCKAPAAWQMALFPPDERGATRSHLLASPGARPATNSRVDALVRVYGPSFQGLLKLMPGILSPIEQAAVESRVRQLTAAGGPAGQGPARSPSCSP